jgi:hypothetical protein
MATTYPIGSGGFSHKLILLKNFIQAAFTWTYMNKKMSLTSGCYLAQRTERTFAYTTIIIQPNLGTKTVALKLVSKRSKAATKR